VTAAAFDAGANRLGALALVLTDRLHGALAASGRSASAGAALSAIATFLDAPSVDQLRQVLGLTSSGTVRLVDSLVRDGLVSRGRAGGGDGDARVTTVALTAKGRRAAKAVVEARRAVLTDALAPLEHADRAVLERLLTTVLEGVVRTGGGGRGWMCRLCETATCGAAERGAPCPVTTAGVAPDGRTPNVARRT
jgi:DNA-binding MarR family transcriptional regulator